MTRRARRVHTHRQRGTLVIKTPVTRKKTRDPRPARIPRRVVHPSVPAAVRRTPFLLDEPRDDTGNRALPAQVTAPTACARSVTTRT